MLVYTGTCAEPNGATGIRVFRMEQASGALTLAQTAPEAGDCFYLVLHPQRDLLFSVDAASVYEGRAGGAVSAFTHDPASGRVTLLNRQFSHGTVPCHISVDPTGAFVLVANYGSGSVAVLPIAADGRLEEASDVAQHDGTGPNSARQEGPHAHFVTPDPSGDHILACDLGADRVLAYCLDRNSGKLTPADVPYTQVNAGAGPRHLAFHPDGQHAYVINELDSTLTAFTYDAAHAALRATQTIPTLPAGVAGDNYPAHVLVDPAGRFVYGSNRGHDSIALFAIDGQSGRITSAGHAAAQGRTPANFAIDPTGSFLLVANHKSGNVVSFKIHGERGTLEPTGHVAEVPAPTCVVFGRP